MRLSVVLAAALLVPVAGCLPDEEATHCTAWTLEDPEEHPHQLHLYIRNERPDTVCIQVRLSGTDVAKVPMQPAQGEAVPTGETSLDWSDARGTIRVGEWNGDRYRTETVDLQKAPHIEIVALEDDLRVQAHEQAPWDAQP